MAKKKKTQETGPETFYPESEHEQIVSLRVSDGMYEAIGQYADAQNSDSLSAAMRELISMGLADSGAMEDAFITAVRENANRKAMRRLAAIMRGGFASMFKAFGDVAIEFDEEEREE